MCMIAHGRNLNKGKVDMVETFDQIFRSGLEAKLDNIFEIDGYRIRRYVNDKGQANIIIVKKIGTKRVYNSERKVTLDAECSPMYIPKLR